MILQMRRNRHEAMTLLSTGFVLPPEHCEFLAASEIMEFIKELFQKHGSIMPSGYWFELITKDEENRERTTEIPAEIDSGEKLHEWYLMEVK